MLRHALIAGATGIVGRALAQHLSAQPNWQVSGCARRSRVSQPLNVIPVDLADAHAVRAALSASKITHVFYCGRADYTQAAKEPIAENVAMLRNVLNAVQSQHLQHVHIVQGSKVYGSDLGPYKTPAQESDPRVAETNWYYEQEDLLAQRSAGAAWQWSASRPHGVCDADAGAVRGLARVIAVYATILKALGEPLCFPGSHAAFHALYQSVDSGLLARAMTWIATTPACASQTFNVTNGDVMRWVHVWPRIADFFGMAAGPVKPVKLVDFMCDKAPLWDTIVREHVLRATPFNEAAVWPYGDFNFNRGYDVASSTIRLRQSGFAECADTGEMFLNHFTRFRKQRLIP